MTMEEHRATMLTLESSGTYKNYLGYPEIFAFAQKHGVNVDVFEKERGINTVYKVSSAVVAESSLCICFLEH